MFAGRHFDRSVILLCMGKWHVDKTYIKIRGRWVYLYRAIDTVDSISAEIVTCWPPSVLFARR